MGVRIVCFTTTANEMCIKKGRITKEFCSTITSSSFRRSKVLTFDNLSEMSKLKSFDLQELPN